MLGLEDPLEQLAAEVLRIVARSLAHSIDEGTENGRVGLEAGNGGRDRGVRGGFGESLVVQVAAATARRQRHDSGTARCRRRRPCAGGLSPLIITSAFETPGHASIIFASVVSLAAVEHGGGFLLGLELGRSA